jgi:hypothetical protein
MGADQKKVAREREASALVAAGHAGTTDGPAVGLYQKN